MKISGDLAVKLGLGAVALLAALLVLKNARSVVGGTVGALGGVIEDVGVGMVEGIGSVVGLPVTNVGECQKCIDEFNAAPWYEQAYLSFKVSANCSAGDYGRFIATGKGPQDISNSPGMHTGGATGSW